MKKKYRAKQASDSLLVGCLLSMSGGLQDAYTYQVRGQVFANAQTGNIVRVGEYLAAGEWTMVLRYMLPLLSFAAGVYTAEAIHSRFHSKGEAIHWRHGVLAVEALVLLSVAWLPQSVNNIANCLVSFVCAMQVEAFRELEGSNYATTMCIGNLRSCMENLFYWRRTKDQKRLHKTCLYAIIILFFFIGAAAGSVASQYWKEATILLCCPLLLAAFALMLRIRNRYFRFLSLATGAEEDAAVVRGEIDPNVIGEEEKK